MPTDIELAQALEITVDKLHYLQNIEIDAVSLSAPINDNDDDTDVLGDFIEDKSTNVEEEIVKKEYLESFKNAVLESEILDQREKEIICLRYGINCDRAHSLEEIGQKSLYEDWLKIISGKKVTINYAKSKYKEIYELAVKNATNLLENARLKKMAQIRDDFNEVGSYLAEKLHLTNFPNRIECYSSITTTCRDYR